MADTRGVFGLRLARILKGKGEWTPLDQVWHSPSLAVTSDTGYFGGGMTPSYVATMDKVTFSTDTTAAAPGANFSVGRNGVAAASSPVAGYFGGGQAGPGTISTMDKTTYSSDTTAALPGADLSSVRKAPLPQQETQLMVTLVVVIILVHQQWIRPHIQVILQ